MSTLVARTAVENTLYSFDRLFDYIVPEKMKNAVSCGQRVMVPFSASNKNRQAMIMELYTQSDDSEVKKLKEIASVLDSEPVLTDEMLKMVTFISTHCFCTYYDAVRCMLPAGINYKISQIYSLTKTAVESLDSLESLVGQEKAIAQFLHSRRTGVKAQVLKDTFGYVDTVVFDKMCDKGILQKCDNAFRAVNDSTVKMIRLKEDSSALDIKLTPKQNAVFEILCTAGEAGVREICYYTGVTSSVVDSLVRKGVAEYFDDEVFRTPKSMTVQKQEITLNAEQQKAYDELFLQYSEKKPTVSLLYGITGSGKTSVFMKLIETAVSDNKGVILMVPEIALTSSLIALFKSHFGDRVAVFHSGLSIGERLDEYKRVKKGIASIAIGTRSAVFAPLTNIGLIIMDEEQEHTYKSEGRPRFHARELAKFRAAQNNCLLLLSSATPSVESFYHAKQGRYNISTIKNRYGNSVLPDVIVADMNLEIPMKGTTGYSNILLDSLEKNLDNKKQSIILLNRRGYNTFVTCKSCKETVTCPNCSISLTYHSANDRLMCHYCGYSVRFSDECPTCHSKGLRLMGSGTQRAESELSEIFPNARVLRMDTDATMTKSAHEKKLMQFANGDYDILVGTSMVAKGLDFPNVTLVGVLSADSMLYSDDYRSFESAFSMLTQVVGRSGRGNEKGMAIVQTYTPENPIIALAANQDYDAFFDTEIKIRRAMLYPPFAQLCLVGFVGSDHSLVKRAADAFSELYTNIVQSDSADIPLRVLGPSSAYVSKVNNKYRYKIILKCRNDAVFRATLAKAIKSFSSIREYSDVSIYADMNPLSF